MALFEEIKPNSQIKGLLPNNIVSVSSTHWHGSDVLEIIYKDQVGVLRSQLLFRNNQDELSLFH